jgi:hypothetical protein
MAEATAAATSLSLTKDDNLSDFPWRKVLQEERTPDTRAISTNGEESRQR